MENYGSILTNIVSTQFYEGMTINSKYLNKLLPIFSPKQNPAYAIDLL